MKRRILCGLIVILLIFIIGILYYYRGGTMGSIYRNVISSKSNYSEMKKSNSNTK